MMNLFGQLVYDWLLIFVPLLVVIDPAGSVPLFLALTEHYPEPRRRAIARRATVVAAITGVSFVIVGQAIFAFLGIRFADFQIAGGILLVVLSIIDLLSSSKPAVDERELLAASDHLDSTVGIVPLAIPLIVGPATLTTGLLLVNTYSLKYTHLIGPALGPVVVVGLVCLAMVVNLLILYGAMRHSDVLVRVVGRQTMAVANKIVMILLAAIAVSMIRQGITSIIGELR